MYTRTTESSIVYGTDSLSFSFSNTDRGEDIDASSFSTHFIIDSNGLIFKTDGSIPRAKTVTIIGGKDQHAHRKDESTGSSYYMSEQQKLVLNKIVYKYGSAYPYTAELVDGNNTQLNETITTILRNALG